MRRRMTNRKRARVRDDHSIVAEIEALERRIDAFDEMDEIEDVADDMDIVDELTETDEFASEDLSEENDVMDDWPMEAREKFAARLLRVARMVLED